MADRKFTVIIMRPRYMLERGDIDDLDTYVAHVTADDARDAIVEAKRQTFMGDRHSGLRPEHANDYRALLVFRGHLSAEAYGWQPGMQS